MCKCNTNNYAIPTRISLKFMILEKFDWKCGKVLINK